MTANELLRLQNSAPFRPFEMLLADGRALTVPHPDFVSVSEEEELVWLFDLAEGVESIDLMLVVSLRFPIRPASSKR